MLLCFIDLLGVADALGLGFFVISGAGIALQLGLPAISVDSDCPCSHCRIDER